MGEGGGRAKTCL